jgi:hypothetical protein
MFLTLTLLFTIALTTIAVPPGNHHGSPENCSSPKTKWETEHFCPIATHPEKYQRLCTPKRLYPKTSKINGVVTMYHGFTACPDAFNEIANVMVEQGFVVLVPLLPGMGLQLGYNCQAKPDECVSHGTNPSEIPISKEGYFEWSRKIIDITKQEAALVHPSLRSNDFKVVSLGLSVGGALAIYASEVADSPFQKVLVANPYLSTSTGQLDFYIYKCTLDGDANGCISSHIKEQINARLKPSVNATVTGVSVPWHPIIKAITNATAQTLDDIVTKKYDGFLTSLWEIFATVGDNSVLLSDKIFNAEMGWGANCVNNKNRGGICAFRIRHLMALHSFVENVVGNIDKISQTVQYANIHSDMDGQSRDSISFAVFNSLKNRGLRASRCRFKYSCDISGILDSGSHGDNHCGMFLCITYMNASKRTFMMKAYHIRAFLKLKVSSTLLIICIGSIHYRTLSPHFFLQIILLLELHLVIRASVLHP